MRESGIVAAMLPGWRQGETARFGPVDQIKHRECVLVICCLMMQVIGTLAELSLAGMEQYAKYTGDLHLYIQSSRHLLEGAIPYRDFPFEYPPLALAPFVIPRLLGGGAGMGDSAYVWTFVAENIAMGMLISIVLKKIARQIDPTSNGIAAMASFSAMLVLGALLAPFRFDLFVTLLTVLALHCALGNCPTKAGLFIGLGIAAKLYPMGLGAIFALHYFLANGPRVAIRFGVAILIALGVVMGTFGILAGAHMLDFVRYHQARGLQIESLQGGIVCLLHCLKITPAASVTNYGASHLVSKAAGALLSWQAVVAAAAIWIFFFLCWQRRGDAKLATSTAQSRARQLVQDLAGVLVLFMLVSKVLSPQYLLWLMPLIALLRGRAGVIFLLAWIVTLIIFPFAYEQLKAISLGAVVLLNVRNALLVWLFVILARRVRHIGPLHRMGADRGGSV
jgi:hypothetical protein